MSEETNDGDGRIVKLISKLTDARITIRAKKDEWSKEAQDESAKKLDLFCLRNIEFLDAVERFVLSDSQTEMDTLSKAIDIQNDVIVKEGMAILATPKKDHALEVFGIMSKALKTDELVAA